MKTYSAAELSQGHIYENATGFYEYSGRKSGDLLYVFYACHLCDNGEIVKTAEERYFTKSELHFE